MGGNEETFDRSIEQNGTMRADRRSVVGGIGAGFASVLSRPGLAMSMNQEFANPGGAGEMSFTGELTIGWVTERFIELDSPDHPAVGTELSCRGMVVTDLAAETEREAFGGGLQWNRFAKNGDATLGRFFRPIEQFTRSNTTIDEDAYEQFELVRIVGLEAADQDFYDKYDFAPFVWAVVTDQSDLQSGRIVDIDAAIRHSDEVRGFEGFQGPFLEILNASMVEDRRSLTGDTDVGETADFTGIQALDDPVLSAYTTDVGYRYKNRFTVPSAGSIVYQGGTITAHDFQTDTLPRENSAEIETADQEVLIGRKRDDSYETVFGDGAEGSNPNTVAVIDVSSSMSDEDTRTGRARIEVARESTVSLLQFLPDSHNLGIVAFSSSADTIVPMTSVGDGRDRLAEELQTLRANGDTSIGAGIAEAMRLLEGRDYPQSILLLSDGGENRSPYVSDVLPTATDRGVRIFTIGMGSGINPNLLRDIAGRTDADVRISPSPEDTREFFQQLATGVQRREELSFVGEKLSEGETTGGTTDVDESVESIQFSLSYPGSVIRLEVQRPDGSVATEDNSGVERRVSGSSEVWNIESPSPGEWSYTAIAEELPEPQRATIEVNADTPVRTELFLTDDVYEQTGTFKLELKATEGKERYTGANAFLVAKHAKSEDATEISLNDDGTGGDPVSGDGIYTGYFHPEEPGEYTFTAVLERGPYETLRREQEETIVVEEVVDQPIRLYEDDSFFASMSLGEIGIVGAIVAGFLGTIVWMMRLMSSDDGGQEA